MKEKIKRRSSSCRSSFREEEAEASFSCSPRLLFTFLIVSPSSSFAAADSTVRFLFSPPLPSSISLLAKENKRKKKSNEEGRMKEGRRKRRKKERAKRKGQRNEKKRKGISGVEKKEREEGNCR